MAYFNSINPAMTRLLQALGVGSDCTDLALSFRAGELSQMTVTRFLTVEEVEALSDYFETEDLQAMPTGTTTYSLIPKSEAE